MSADGESADADSSIAGEQPPQYPAMLISYTSSDSLGRYANFVRRGNAGLAGSAVVGPVSEQEAQLIILNAKPPVKPRKPAEPEKPRAGWPKGRALSPEHREKIAAAQRGIPRGPQSKKHRAKLSAVNRRKGHSHTAETRAKIAATPRAKPRPHKPLSAEQRAKIRASNRGKKHKKIAQRTCLTHEVTYAANMTTRFHSRPECRVVPAWQHGP